MYESVPLGTRKKSLLNILTSYEMLPLKLCASPFKTKTLMGFMTRGNLDVFKSVQNSDKGDIVCVKDYSLSR